MHRNSSTGKAFLSFTIFCFAFVPLNANAIFFFFFPVPSFGAKGDSCVAETAKAGDTFRSPNGNVATIKSVSGTSSRCKAADKPILASVDYAMATTFSSKAGINLPNGYSSQSLTNLQQFNGTLLSAKDNATDSGVLVLSTKREVISDTQKYVVNVRGNQSKSLDDPQQSEIEKMTINGMKAWRFETKGKLRNLFGTRYSYLTTIIEAEQEVVFINAWTYTSRYENAGKEELKKLALSVTGIKSDTAQTAPSQTDTPQAAITNIDTLQSESWPVVAPGAGPVINLPTPALTPTAATPLSDQATSSSVPNPRSEQAISPAALGKSPVTSGASANRLRDLNKLYKEGVITQEDFEVKKKEILKSM